MLHHPAMMTQQVAAILALVQRQHFAGIDIDYENLHAEPDRQAFTAFRCRVRRARCMRKAGPLGGAVRQGR